MILRKICAQSDQSNKNQILGQTNANTHDQFMLNEQFERFENLQAKFNRNKIIGRKNEVLRFLLETAGLGEQDMPGSGSTQSFNQDNITKALMSSMIQSNQFAEFGGAHDAKRDLKS